MRRFAITGGAMRRLAKEVEAISRQDKTTDDVDDVMLIRQNWRQRDQNEPDHRRNANETTRMTKITIEQN